MAERVIHLLQDFLSARILQVPHCAGQVFMAHPLLDRTEVYTGLQVRGRES